MKILQFTVLVLALFVFAGNAQTITDRSEKSVLSGTIFDEQGAVIPQTKITFTNQAGYEFIALSNDVGVYKIELNKGKYKIEFYKEGFQTSVFENYKLIFRTKMQLDVALEVASIGDCSPKESEQQKSSSMMDKNKKTKKPEIRVCM